MRNGNGLVADKTGDGIFEQIAARMWEYARANPRLNTSAALAPYRQTIGGLQLVLFINASRRVYLSASRLGAYPSTRELMAIRRDFGAPATAREQRRVVGLHFIVSFTWQHTEPGKLFELGPVNQAGGT